MPSDGVSVRQVFVVSDFLVTTLLNLISPFFFRGCCFLWRQFLECTGRLAKRPDQIHANCCCELNTGNAAAWHAMPWRLDGLTVSTNLNGSLTHANLNGFRG